jgi:hypothetical protein
MMINQGTIKIKPLMPIKKYYHAITDRVVLGLADDEK